jgi:hypothetical protein
MAAAKTKKQPKRKPKSHRKGERKLSLRCAGCAELDHTDALLRLVVVDGHGVVVDLRERLPGTPIHLHPRPLCLKGCAAADPAPTTPAVPEAVLRDAMTNFLDNAILAELSRVAASGQAVGGHDKLAAVLREGRIACVFVAHDAASGTMASLRRAAGPSLPFHPLGLDKDALGTRVGQPARAAVGVPSSRASAVLEKWLGLRWQLGEATS